jgi:phytoene dehydrogenase-like protein
MSDRTFNVAVIGGGIAGMSTAARLQAANESTVVLEQHDQLGGCAGYYCQDGFAFDVGATTLVDFIEGGVGGQFLDRIGFDPPAIEIQDAYQLWLPDRTATLYHDQSQWATERRATFGDGEAHRQFYGFLDRLAETLWELTRADVKLPIQSLGDPSRNASAVGLSNATLFRYLRWTMADVLRESGLWCSPVEERFVSDPAVRREAIHHLEQLADGTIISLYELSGDIDRLLAIVADHVPRGVLR